MLVTRLEQVTEHMVMSMVVVQKMQGLHPIQAVVQAGTEHSNMVQRLTIQTLGNAQNWGSIGTAKMYTTSTSGSSS